jgi:hypothetical protein
MLYFLIIPNTFESNQKLAILSLIFVVTYLIPLLILVLLKKLGFINSYQTETIKERKLPITLMIIVFYLLANTLEKTTNLRDLAILFYATTLGLFFIYFLFYFKIKASIHLLSLGIILGFFMVLSSIYSQIYLLIYIIILLLAGLLASSRLHLKAHTNKEVYIGFFTGIIATQLVHYLL